MSARNSGFSRCVALDSERMVHGPNGYINMVNGYVVNMSEQVSNACSRGSIVDSDARRDGQPEGVDRWIQTAKGLAGQKEAVPVFARMILGQARYPARILLFLVAALLLTLVVSAVPRQAEAAAKAPSECFEYPDGTIECE